MFTLMGAGILFFLSSAPATACNFSELTLTNVTPLGSGQYALDLRFCVGAGRTGVTKGAEDNTSTFAFLVSSGVGLVDFPDTLVSPASGAIYRDTLLGTDTLVYYSESYAYWACVFSTAMCGEARQVCMDITIVTDGLPDSLWVLGAEGNGNPYAGCSFDPDMKVYPANSVCSISLNPVVDPATCNASNDGSIGLSPSGGQPPYTYHWSTGATTSTITNLNTGTYAVTVTDGNACTASGSYDVSTANAVQANGNVTHHDCATSKGSINLGPSGGAPPYTYTWSNGATTEDVSNLDAGTYMVTIHHLGGTCHSPFSFAVNSDPATTDLGTDKTVYRGYAPAECTTLNPESSGGAAPYTYAWSTGATSSTLNVCPTSTTTYAVTVTDARGCTATDAVVVNVVDVRCGLLNLGIKVCHSGTTLCVPQSQVAGHLNHGDYLGNCMSKVGGNVAGDTGFPLEISAFPVPASSEVHFLVHATESGTLDIRIVDLLGNEVLRREDISLVADEGVQVTCDVARLASGIYIARIGHSNGNVRSVKFSVAR